ncbi:hypothetical protein HC766_01030 [Candidatus Gracilibacteria bacterium]|nr:hypothetical protein [Thermales bacterium]NJL97004.1 hypothetical protein [Candidatus Gracilibacteria bacterium]NJS40963.1 hypothetical protein [Candidatus Gracilibacteria bacterium]
MTNKNIFAIISVSCLFISSSFLLSSNSILSDTIINSLQNNLFAEAQYGSPVANDDIATTSVDTPVIIDVLDNDVDLGIGPLSLNQDDCFPSAFLGGLNVYADIVTQPANGTAIRNGTVPNHTITYTPDPGFSGVDTFTYDTCDVDAQENSNVATVTVTVNTPPVLASQSITITKGNTQSFNPLAATDANNNTPITFNTPAINPLLGCVESSTGIQGNIITCTPDNSITAGVYTFQITPTDSLSLSGNPATFTVEVIDPTTTQNPTIQIFKDKMDGTVKIDDTIKIQIDITNPNNLELVNLSVTATLDESKIKPIVETINEGTISGTKYSNFGVLQVLAQNFTSSINGNTINIQIPQLNPNTTRSFVFDVQALDDGIGQINALIAINNSQVSSANTNIPISQLAQTTNLLRTGGKTLNITILSLVLITSLGILSAIGLHSRQSKITKI